MTDAMIYDLFLTCLHATPLASQTKLFTQLEPTQWEVLITLADKQRVTPLLYHRIKTHGLAPLLPQAVLTQLQMARRRNAMRNLHLYQELVQLLKALHAQDIPVIVLKGAYLAQAVYQDPVLRVMVDCDLMIPEFALPTAVEILTALGYHSLQPVLMAERKANGHHLPRFVKPNGAASVEIHWTITRPGQIYTIDMGELWARAQPFTVAGFATLALCHEDLLLHLCLHATYQHRFMQGVRPLCDIAEMVARYGAELDWDALCQRSVAWGWDKGVYLALYLSHSLLGAAIPSQVLATLKPTDLSPQLVAAAKAHLFVAYERVHCKKGITATKTQKSQNFTGEGF